MLLARSKPMTPPHKMARTNLKQTEPKFIPNEAVEITLEDNLKLKDTYG